MLMNLFSSFDPFCQLLNLMLSMNWISSLLMFILFPITMWISVNRNYSCLNSLLSILSKEFKLVMTGKKTSSHMLFSSLLFTIFFNNFMGLFPYIFTSSSHLCFSLMFSLSLWFSFMLFGWINNTNLMFCHLVPVGTPTPLMPLLVCIESISNIIRPGTLSIRLSANMISGHLLLTLIGNQGMNLNQIMILVLIIFQSLLMILEISVSAIQSYVFSILSSLYSGEINHE